MSISSASQVTPVLRAIWPNAPRGARREFLELGPIPRAGIIPRYHGWPGKQAGGEKGVHVGVAPAARMNRFHPRL